MSTTLRPPFVIAKAEIRFVDAPTYCRLMTSHRSLVRSDDHAKGWRGLTDTERNVRYVIDAQRLLQHAIFPAP